MAVGSGVLESELDADDSEVLAVELDCPLLAVATEDEGKDSEVVLVDDGNVIVSNEDPAGGLGD